jgi:hypothetical protein
VSRQTYLMRRLMVLGVTALVVAGVVLAAKAAFGSDASASSDGSTVPTDPSTTAATEADAGDPATTTPTTAPAAPSTTPAAEGPFVPTADHQARVYIAGDSDAGAFGPTLMDQLDDTGVVESTLDYKVSSGLARPDFFDWPAHLRQVIPAADPQIVVVTFGGNDAQDILIDGRSRGTTTPEWRAEYGKRVGEVMDYLTENGRSLIWVGIPNAVSAEFTARLEPLRAVTMEQAAARADRVVYIDTWQRFTGRNGGYAEYVVDPRDGMVKPVRQSDGFHLNVTGAEILSLDIAAAVKEALRARGASI